MDGDAAILGPAGKLEAKQRGDGTGTPLGPPVKLTQLLSTADNFAKAEGDDGQIVAMHTQHRKASNAPARAAITAPAAASPRSQVRYW